MTKAQPSWRSALWIFALAGVQLVGNGSAMAGAIDKIRADQTIRIAYREDAPPFSYKEPNSTEPTGFIVNLCRGVTKKLGEQLGVASLKITYVPVTAANRFDAIQKNDADLLCEATSATLSRRAKVNFSIPTFVDGASLLSTDRTLGDFKSLAGKKIGVLGGTTTEEALRNALKSADVSAEIIPTKTHTEAIAMLDDGKVIAYFGDRSILLSLIKGAKASKELGIADTYLTLEPYALALARGDDEFRLAIDTALSRIYRSGEIAEIFERSFGKARAGDPITMLYVMSALPD